VSSCSYSSLFLFLPTPRLPTLSTLSLSNALWFYAKLSLPPSPALLAAYWPALGAALPRVDIRGLVSVLWAAAALGLEVPPAIMDGLLLETQVGVGGM
jgi:hypothetical protein